MSNELTLKVNGKSYEGWKTVRLTRSIEQLAHTFTVSYADRWTDEGQSWPIYEDDVVEVLIDGKTVISGYVVDTTDSEDPTQTALEVSGKSKTCDLVDCSAIHKTGAWKDSSIGQIAADLCQPFGIDVTIEGDQGEKFRRFALQDSETVHEALLRMARMRGFLLTTTPDGDLLITRVGTKKTATILKRGENILSSSRKGSRTDRFSEYTVKSQISGDDNTFARNANQKRTATDAGVTRYRPLVMQAENQEAGTEMQKRVDWERNTRAGRSLRLTYAVQGWLCNEGVWAPNTLVSVDDSRRKIRGEFLISGVSLTRDEQGTVTELELADPRAFDVEPFTPKTKVSNNPFKL